MTKEEINQLGHAFFDGKTLQCRDYGGWLDWIYADCPKFVVGDTWRIKPDEPKTITICTFTHPHGNVERISYPSDRFDSFSRNDQWTHIKSLDQVVEVE